MIHLNRNTSNTIVLTLAESDPAADMYFTLVLTSCQTKETYTIDLTDESSYTDRYNKFTIDLNIGSTVLDLPQGYYDYAVYDIGSPAKVLEIGKCLVGPDPIVKTEFAEYDNDADIIFDETK